MCNSIASVLADDRFLLVAQDGTPTPGDAALVELSAHALASRLALFLWNSGPDEVLLALADSLDSADADAVVASLVLAVRRGGTGATVTLSALADSLQDRLRALREIESERAKPRIVVRQVTIITSVVMGAAMLLGRDFFAPYSTPLGQVILAALIAAYAGSIAMLRRMTVPRRRARILGAGS